MAMDKSQMKDAFRCAFSEEFAYVPQCEDEIEYSFSGQFEKKMQKLIVAEKKTLWHCFNTPLKRVAVIAVSFLVLFTTACTIPAVRNEVFELINEIHEKFVHLFTTENDNDTIAEIYQVAYLPEGFVLVSTEQNALEIVTVYENSQGDILQFSQKAAGAFQMFLDAEYGEVSEIVIDGCEIHMYVRPEATIAIWTRGNSVQILTYLGAITEEDFMQILVSIEPIE